MGHYYEGGDSRKRLDYIFENCISYTHNPLENMNMSLKSRDKRKSRRHREEMEERRGSHDITTFVSRTHKQQVLWESLVKNTYTIAVGCSGTGKTLTGFHFGMDYLASGHFEKFVYVRSDVGTEFQRGRGAIKGDYGEKFMPLLTPLIDNASLVFRNRGAFEYLINKGIIEGVFLEDIRGRTFNNCFVLADEMQNTTVNQAKTIITRIGKNSKLALIGDTSQSDLNVFNRTNGLIDAYDRIGHIDGVGTVKFQVEDSVRNGLLGRILNAYEG